MCLQLFMIIHSLDQKTVTTRPHVLCELSVMKHTQKTIDCYKNLISQLHKEINDVKDQIKRYVN